MIFRGHQVHVQFLHMYFHILVHRFCICFLYGGQWQFGRSEIVMTIARDLTKQSPLQEKRALPTEAHRSQTPHPINSDVGSWILPALNEIYNSSKASLSISSALPAEEMLARSFLKSLEELSRANFSETSIRAFSLSCFHDSKYLEKNLFSRLLSFVRNQCPNFRDIPAEEAVPEIELLEAVNLYRNPEIYEFCGAVQVTFRASQLNANMTVDYGIFGRGATLHSGSLNDVISMKAPEMSKILFIENRTNYEDYIAGKRAPDELVIQAMLETGLRLEQEAFLMEKIEG